jgi:hypothetical protein
LIYLDSTVRSLTASLNTSTSTTQLDYTACYFDVPAKLKEDFSDYLGGTMVTTSINTTSVTIVAAPQQNVTRNIESLFLYNADVTSAVLTVKYNDNGSTRVLNKQTLLSGETLVYEDGAGWQVT